MYNDLPHREHRCLCAAVHSWCIQTRADSQSVGWWRRCRRDVIDHPVAQCLHSSLPRCLLEPSPAFDILSFPHTHTHTQGAESKARGRQDNISSHLTTTHWSGGTSWGGLTREHPNSWDLQCLCWKCWSLRGVCACVCVCVSGAKYFCVIFFFF